MERTIRGASIGEKWEQFAETNPFAYIMTDLAEAGQEAFWQSGESTVREEILPVLDEGNVPRDLGLEIGCGVGRLVLPLSRIFGQTIGVDISRGMVRQAISFANERGVTNARFVAVDSPDELPSAVPDAVGQVTFIYSLLVFQHIQDFQVIESYLSAVRRLLRHDGTAYLQFDTRNQTLDYKVKMVIPDFMLPRLLRRGIRRVRREPSEIEYAFARNGLRVIREMTASTSYHRYVVQLA